MLLHYIYYILRCDWPVTQTFLWGASMEIKSFPLNFPVFYHLAVRGKTQESNEDAINDLLNPNQDAPENSEDQLHINASNCTRYLNGERAVPKKNLTAINNCSLNTLKNNIMNLQLSSIDESVKCIISLLHAGLLTSNYSEELISSYYTKKDSSEEFLAIILKKIAASYCNASNKTQKYITDKSAITPISIHSNILNIYEKISQKFPVFSFRSYIVALQDVLRHRDIEYDVLLVTATIYHRHPSNTPTPQDILQFFEQHIPADFQYGEDQINLALFQLLSKGILIINDGVLLPECITILGSKKDIEAEINLLTNIQNSFQNDVCNKLIFFSTDGKHTIENGEETIEP